MHSLDEAIDAVFSDRDIQPADVPQLDLYMDQILSLFEQCLGGSKRDPSDKLLTKTMVNNYVKEGLITPVRGKKYTRQQIMQLICVYHLKQTLRLGDIKALTGRTTWTLKPATPACWRTRRACAMPSPRCCAGSCPRMRTIPMHGSPCALH